jgi:hypothetical protein
MSNKKYRIAKGKVTKIRKGKPRIIIDDDDFVYFKLFETEQKNKRLELENKELKEELTKYKKLIKFIKKIITFPDDDSIDYELASISDEEFWEMLD